MIWNGHVHVLSLVVGPLFRQDVVKESHVVQQLLVVDLLSRVHALESLLLEVRRSGLGFAEVAACGAKCAGLRHNPTSLCSR